MPTTTTTTISGTRHEASIHQGSRLLLCLSLVRWFVRKPSVRRHGAPAPAGSARRPPRVSRSAGVHDKHEVEELIGSVMMEGCVATTNMSDALQQ